MTRQPLHARRHRGNTMVLVTGILVLLVIIATAFVTRTNAGRDTATAVRQSETRDATANTIARSLAYEVSLALFPSPVDYDPTDPAQLVDYTTGVVASSNRPRLSPVANPIRYGIDRDVIDNATGGIGADGEPDFPYNFAPFQTVPFTNWPDPNNDEPNWPTLDPSSMSASGLNLFAIHGIGVGNPVGGPGFGDTRWLRDNEPFRWDTNGDGWAEAYAHWIHLSNLARPNNGYIPLVDISNVESSVGWFLNDATGGDGPIYHIPVEQWLPILPGNNNLATGNAFYDFNDPDDFRNLWLDWFSPNYANLNMYSQIGEAPHNRYRLLELGPPQDEFIGGTDRWSVSRVLADTDGDGYTDAYWFVSPTPVVNGVRTIVAMSIIDNHAMLNANVATRFVHSNIGTPGGQLQKTLGWTPSDLALFGELAYTPAMTGFTGFYDNPNNQVLFAGGDYFQIRYDGHRAPNGLPPDATHWARHVNETGLGVNGALLTPNLADRLDYWQRNGRHGTSSEVGYSPFTLSDEIELRMYYGQNYPWIKSRYENSTQDSDVNSADEFLRTDLNYEESSEFLDQLRNRMLVMDSRHRLTLYNNVRNDIMPPWLWERQFPLDEDFSGGIDADERLEFELGRRKFDLRGRFDYSWLYGNTGQGLDALGPGSLDRRFARELIRDIAERAFIDDPNNPMLTYFGNANATVSTAPAPLTALQASYMAAAGLASNLDAFRDDDADVDLSEAVIVSDPGNTQSEESRMLPLEAQPFIVEAFIAHVYPGSEIPPTSDLGEVYSNAGEFVVFDDDQTTVVVVQLANPFDRAIDLRHYKLSVFGQELDFDDIPGSVNTVLPQATDDEPTTAIVFAIEPVVNDDNIKERWLDFLDIEEMSPAADPMVNVLPAALRFDLTDILGAGGFSSFTNPWSTSRSHYDSTNAQSVVLKRVIADGGGGFEDVVVDRIDDTTTPEFRDAVISAGDPMFGEKPDPIDSVPPNPTDGIYGPPGYALGVDANDQPYTHWAQYFRATRAWGLDMNGNGVSDPAERNPRYVFGEMAVVTPEGDASAGGDGTPHGKFDGGPMGNLEGVKYDFRTSPDLGPGFGATNGWFGRTYHSSASTDGTPVRISRKPTFFDLSFGGVPHKGWYGQGDSVDEPPLSDGGSWHTRLAFPMQMMQKDADFEQIGEVLNVWMFGHELVFETDDFTGNTDFASGRADDGTRRTFSEFMADDGLVGAWADSSGPSIDLYNIRVNRLRTQPAARGSSVLGQVVGAGDPAEPIDVRHRQPALPAGLRLLDAFVCDGRGINPAPDLDLDGFVNDADDQALAHLFNANGFTGRGTPGLINLNTASPEVLRALPHWYRVVHEVHAVTGNPRTMVAEATTMYRDGTSGNPNYPTPSPWVTDGTLITPQYGNRQVVGNASNQDDIRRERGFASIGELLLVNRPAPDFNSDGFPDDSVDPIHGFDLFGGMWGMDLNSAADTFAPFVDGNGNAESVHISTDVHYEADAGGGELPDFVAKDAEEANLLFSGMSNLVTTRSDTFTVYFRVRSFRQNPNTLMWDATDPEYIIDDSRYVMLVDRSEVNHPNDRPKILYLEKLPN